MNEAELDTFRKNHRGPVIGRSDAGYDEARKLYNGMIDKRPLLIARCADAGTAWTFRSHLRCRDIAHAHCDDEIYGYVQDMLDGHAYECAGATDPDFVGCDCGERGA